MSAQAGDEAAPAVMTYYDAAGVLPQCSEGPAGCDLGQHQQPFFFFLKKQGRRRL